jgi:folate-binding protein YgfZ
LNDVFVYPDTAGIGGEGREGWLIEVDAKEANGLAKHVKRYKLRAKFDVRVIEEDERRVWSVWDEGSGTEEGSPAHALSMSLSSVETDFEKGILGSLDTRAPGMGRRLLLPGDEKPKVEMEESTEDSYRIRRYLKGVPEGQDELFREHSLPQESNIDFMGGVDYRKGCYVGQELTIRTHHTGVVRKRVLPVMLYRKEGEMPETLEYKTHPDLGVDVNTIPSQTSIGRFEKRGRSAGKWLSGVGNIGLGLCRLETMTGMEVGGEVGGYKEGDEFQLEWNVEGEEKSEIVKIKAFVPSWHLRK